MHIRLFIIKHLTITFFLFIIAGELLGQNPTINHINDKHYVETSSPTVQTINLTGISGETPINVTASCDNTALIPNSDSNLHVDYTSPSTTATLTLTPTINTNGQAIITITVTNGSSVSTDSTFVVSINGKPNFEATGTPLFAENLSGTVIDINAIDPEDSTVLYSMQSDVSDNNLFSINPETGEITFINPPDYENPADNNSDNDYIVKVAATDNGIPTASDTIQITITVTDIDESPIAVVDTFATSEDVTLTVTANGILINDSDPENATITPTLNPDSETNGQVTALNPDGSFTFEPDSNFYGISQFTYYITDQTTHTSNTTTVTINVAAVNDTPIITSNDTIFIDENNITVETVTTTDEENNTITYSITEGVDTALFSITPTGNISFKDAPNYENPQDYDTDNIYNITIKATDNGTPIADSTTQNIAIVVRDINESAPLFSSAETDTINENQTDILTVIAADEESSTITYSLDPGTNDNDLFSITNTTGILTFKIAPDFENPSDANSDNIYTITVIASDNQTPDFTTTQTITITVADINEDAPIFNNLPSNISVNENQIDILTAEATDPEGNEITYLLEEDVNDNNLFTIDASTGILIFNSAPDFESPTDEDSDNNYVVTIDASDNQENPDTTQQQVTIAVTDINEAPVAINDTLTTDEDTPLTITESNLLLNDTDPENNTLTCSRGDSTSNGTLVYNGDNTYTYTPNSNFNGSDHFTYTINDNEFTSIPATVTIDITPINDPPYFTSEDTLHFNENQTGTIVDINARDPENENVTLNFTNGYGDNNLFLLSEDGLLTYITAPDYENPTDQDADNIYSVSITATDDAATPASFSQIITIIIDDINEAPSFNAVIDPSVAENQLSVITLTTTDSEKDSVSYSLPNIGDNSFFNIDANGNITFEIAPNFESPADADRMNTYDITVDATDNGTPPQTSSINFTATVTNINEAPIVTNDTYLTEEDTELQVTADSLLSNDSDEEGADLTITSFSQPTQGNITNFDNSNGTFTYNPNTNFNGKDSISYTVSDGTNTSNGKAYFNVGGVNDPPVVYDDTYTIHEDGTLTREALSGILSNDNDPDNDPLFVTIIDSVNHGFLNINTNDGSFIYSPSQDFNGRDTLIYTASDGVANSEDSAIVVITVTPVNDAPIALNDTTIVYEDSTVVINIVANDKDVDGILDPSSIVLININAGSILDNTDGLITFKHDGTETISAGFSYTINDNNGETSNTASIIIDVIPVNDLPIVDDISDISINEGGSVDINLIEHFSDDDGTPDVASINIYDIANGSYTDNGNGIITFAHDSSETVSAGFSYSINDDLGATSNQASVSLSVNPVNDAPIFTSSDTVFVEENQANIMAVETTDAEDNNIEYSLASGSDNALFAINNTTGILSFSSLPNFEEPHDFDQNNTYIVTVMATDDGTPTVQAVSKTFVIVVTNVNEAPVASDDSYTIFEDDTLTTTLANGILANDNDQDEDILEITIQRDAAHGELVMNSDGTFRYIPQNNYNGEDSFTYTVSDGESSSFATVTITITAVNDIPVANDDTYSVDEDSHLSVSVADGVLKNDDDPDNTNLIVSLQDSVAHGSLYLNTNGSFQYTPESNYNGTDIFTYTLSDGQSTSNRAAIVTITVNTVNDAPTVQSDSYETNEDVILNVSEAGGVLYNDSDLDNDELTVLISDSVSHGNITLNTNGSFVYTPDTDYYGLDQFTYIVSDNTVTSAKVEVNITIHAVNDNPVANDDSGTVNEGNSTQINIVANDNDVDGTLDYNSLIISNVINGSFVDNENGTITFTHDGSETTSAGFSYTIKDNNGAISNSANVAITVVEENDIPVANNDEATVNEGESVIINVINNDTDADGSLDNSSIDFSNIVNGECTNNNDGTVTFLHNGSETTTASFSYTIKDNLGAVSNVANISISVIPQNDAPVTVDDDAVVNEGDTVLINIIANDYDSDGSLNKNSILLGSSTNGTVTDNKDGTITFIHDGSETTSGSFSYIISDNEGSASRLTNVTITIIPVNDVPIFTSEQTVTINETEHDVITVTATDAENNTIAYTLADVDDNNLFNLNSSTGVLTFKEAPDYEIPDDTDHDNIYNVTVTATDNGSPARLTLQQISITIQNINEAPYAEADSYRLNEDDTLTVVAPGVMSNDNDQENDVLTTQVYNNVSHGNLIFNTDGSFSYIPEENYNETDLFSYYVNDGNSNSDTVIVELIIQPQNDAPVANDDLYNSEEDKTLIVNSPGVLTNDYDIDNNTLTAVLISSTKNGSTTLNSDGSYSYLPNQNFAGIDTFSYVANDGNLKSDTVNVIINIGQTNDAPVSINDAYSVNEDETLTTAPSSVLTNDTDPDNNSLSAVLASSVSHGSLTFNLNGSFIYTPEKNYNGNDNFTYKASDGQSEGNIATVSITVLPINDPPIATDDYFYTAEDIPGNINVISNDTDPNDNEGGIASNSINIISAPLHGTAFISGDRINYSPYSRFYGNDTLTYAVFDTGYPLPALSNTAYVYIKVARRHPLAINDSVSTNEDVSIDINILQNDQDIDIDPTTVTIGTPPSHGTITVDQISGVVKYIPNKDYFGLIENSTGDGFTYSVKDKTGLASDIANVVIDILPVPDSPVTANVIRSTSENVSVAVNIDEITSDPDNDINYNSVEFIKSPNNGSVINNSINKEIVYTPNSGFSGNDTLTFRIHDLKGNISNISEIVITVSNEAPNANNDNYTINEDQSTLFNVLLNDTDPQNNIVTDSLIILTAPLHGNAVVNSTAGTITYTPEKDYFGEDNLTYRITDATYYSDQAQVSITINTVNDPPIATDDYFETQEDQSLKFDAINNDFDIDNQIDSSSISIFKAPLHGQVNIDETTHLLTYIPETNYNGTDSIVYEISDISKASAQGVTHITITPVEDSPTPQSDILTTYEETEVSANILLNDIDIENDIDSCSIVIISQPEHGTVVVSGHPNYGFIKYTPDINFLGTDNLTYQISDTTGLTGQAEITITVNNVPDKPIAVDDNIFIAEDSTVTLNVLLNDYDADNNIDSSQISIVTYPDNGSLEILNNRIIYTPASDYNGTDKFKYQICDSTNLCDSAFVYINITPVNDKPIAIGDKYTLNEDATITMNVLLNDIDADNNIDSSKLIVLSCTKNGNLNIVNNRITYTPNSNFNGVDNFTYRICDFTDLCDTAIVNITVIPVNDYPLANDNNYSMLEDETLTMNVLTDDTDSDNNIDSSKLSIINLPLNGSIEISNNRIIYTPASNYNGTDKLKYQVCDSTNLCDSAWVYISITPVNDAPIASNDHGSTIPGQSTIIINVTENDYDVDNNLNISSITIVNSPLHGSVNIDKNNGIINYIPNNEYYGDDYFTYRICDTNDACDTATVFLEITSGNIAPVTLPDYVETNEDSSIDITPGKNDTDSNDNIDLTSVTIVKPPANGTATLETGTDLINYKPSLNFNGNDTIIYSICDDEGLCSTGNIYITILPVNDMPNAVIRKIETSDNSTLDIDVLSFCTDPENDLLTVSIYEHTPVIDGIATVNKNGNIKYESAKGIYCKSEQIIYKICDTGGLCDTASIFVTLYPTDSDGDNIPDDIEGDGDPDNDGIPNFMDSDSDGDDISDLIESAITNPCNYVLPDNDDDSIPDYLDNDSDGDGVPDIDEGDDDCDDDGIPNYLDMEDDCVERLDTPDTFSPNGDGINDYFKIPGANELTGDKIYIYNRWGGLVYESDNYDNTWDGRSLSGLMGSNELQEGTYFFIYKPDETMQVYKGVVYLKR